MNFTEKLIADQAAQAAEIAELKQSLAALTGKLNPPKPAPMSPEGFGGGPQNVAESLEDTVERIHQRAADHQALEASYMAKRREGLSDGQWRDDCGIIRDREGKVVPSGKALEKQIAAAAAHEKAAREADEAWRALVELPNRNAAVISDADDE